MPVVLVAEDEPPLVEVLTYNLGKAGFDTLTAMDGDEALTQAQTQRPDVMVLDWMMPGKSGIEVCRTIREMPDIHNLPILMLTARGDEADRIQGLDAGADDYMVKPFSPRELVARVRALLRRTQPNSADITLAFGDISLNTEQHKVTARGATVKLGPTEYRLLKFLMECPGRVYSREILLDRVWSNGVHVESRTVDVHIRRLRKALLDAGGFDPIRTVRGAGYSLDHDTL
ncbi:phosphate regulon transcriptional regulator PhoB [Magnetovibrio sp.]|uniref:phosphate regulon transcriptional regulator PhoB n=1 Tax=Magnetovibrio sp. TaxID=2024836 RepID=UPI002F954814